MYIFQCDSHNTSAPAYKKSKEGTKQRKTTKNVFEAEVKAFIGQWVSCSCAQAYGTIKI